MRKMNTIIENSQLSDKNGEKTNNDLFSTITEHLKNDTFNMLADAYFANLIRDYFIKNPKDLTIELKKVRNDWPNLCNSIATKANDLMRNVMFKNKDYAKKELELKMLSTELTTMLANGRPIEDKEVLEKKMQILEVQKELSKIPPLVEQDMRFSGKNLSGFISKVTSAMMDIEPSSEPSDLDVRKTIKFDKKMDLQTALFTLLWNTRHETIPLSVLNIKGWAARFVKRLNGEYESQNHPSMLILRSRSDNGQVKGNSGKTTLVKSCLNMLHAKGLNVSLPHTGLSIPTNSRIDRGMSDKTMVFFDDIKFDDVPWETLNRFLDGLPIKNRGKYLKEEYIFGFGSVIGTTNYDLPYPNKERYPTIEFTPNDAPIVSKHKCVVEHAHFICDEKNRVFDFSDAWETLFAYAQENQEEWLSDYITEKKRVTSWCSCQRTKLESLIIAYLDSKWETDRQMIENSLRSNPDIHINRTFTPSTLLEHIRRDYREEFKSLKLVSVIDALYNLKVERANTTDNQYMMSFKYPERYLDESVKVDGVEKIWNWINENAYKSASNQKELS